MNDIRRRLAEIDKQLDQGLSYYYKQIITTTPLVICALGLILGIVLEEYLYLSIKLWFCLLIFSVISLAVILTVRPAFNHLTLPLLTFIFFLNLGAIRLINFYTPSQNDIRNLITTESQIAFLRGIIITEPYIDTNDWPFSKFSPTDRGSSFYLKAAEAQTSAGWMKIKGLIRVKVNESILDMKSGDTIQMYCHLNKFSPPANPGEFDIAGYMNRKGVYVAASVDSRQTIEVLNRTGNGLFTSIRTKMRKLAIEALLGGPYPQEQSESLLLALVLGYRTNIDKETFNAFRKTGLLHFICLSGMNFGIVIGFIWWICKTTGLMKPARAIVCTIAAAAFLMVIPENAPALRAAVICFAFCASFIFRRISNPFNSLSLAAIILLLIRPTGVFEPDWQLSFVSVLGILLLSKPINNFLDEIAYNRLTEPLKLIPFGRITLRFIYLVISAFSVSMAAWFANIGILLYHFYAIQWLTSIWTVLVSPLIALISLIGYLKLFIAAFLPTAAGLMGTLANWLSDFVICVVKLFAELDISEMLIGKTNLSVILLLYILIVIAFFFRFKNISLNKTIFTLLAFTFIALPGLPWLQNTSNKNMMITVLDVGHGQSIVAQLPGGTNILLDSGSLNRSDVGTRIVTPFLRYSGIGKLDAVIISHPDIDHINGLLEVADNCKIKSIYSDEILNDNKMNSPGRFLNDRLIKKRIQIKPFKDNLFEEEFASVKLLWPDKEIYEDNKINTNDKSAVILFEYAARKVLVCSDIEKLAQNQLLELYPNLKADVFITPHHGSIKTLEFSFLDKTAVNVTITSSSKSSFEKGRVISQLKNRKSYFTATDGAVKIVINKDGLVKTTTFIK